jgi:hypothetical protein
MSDVTRLLEAAARGDRKAAAKPGRRRSSGSATARGNSSSRVAVISGRMSEVSQLSSEARLLPIRQFDERIGLTRASSVRNSRLGLLHLEEAVVVLQAQLNRFELKLDGLIPTDRGSFE